MAAALADDLACVICLSLLCEPTTLPCGHSFCRNCLVTALDRGTKRCPICRRPCSNVDPETHPVNVTLKNVVERLFPSQYAERLREATAQRAAWAAKVPLFCMANLLFPHQPLGLHLFEPRYRKMIERVGGTTRRFGYVTDYAPRPGTIGVMAELSEFAATAMGTFMVHATAKARFRVTESWVDEEAYGLCYARVEPFRDTEETAVAALATAAAQYSRDRLRGASGMASGGTLADGRAIDTYTPSPLEIVAAAAAIGPALLVASGGPASSRRQLPPPISPFLATTAAGGGIAAASSSSAGAGSFLGFPGGAASSGPPLRPIAAGGGSSGLSFTVTSTTSTSAVASAAAATSASGAAGMAACAPLSSVPGAAVSPAVLQLYIANLSLASTAPAPAATTVSAAGATAEAAGTATSSSGGVARPAVEVGAASASSDSDMVCSSSGGGGGGAGVGIGAAYACAALVTPSGEVLSDSDRRNAVRSHEVASAVWRNYVLCLASAQLMMAALAPEKRARLYAQFGPLLSPSEASTAMAPQLLSFWLASIVPLRQEHREQLLTCDTMAQRLWKLLQCLWPRYAVPGLPTATAIEYVECGMHLDEVHASLETQGFFPAAAAFPPTLPVPPEASAIVAAGSAASRARREREAAAAAAAPLGAEVHGAGADEDDDDVDALRASMLGAPADDGSGTDEDSLGDDSHVELLAAEVPRAAAASYSGPAGAGSGHGTTGPARDDNSDLDSDGDDRITGVAAPRSSAATAARASARAAAMLAAPAAGSSADADGDASMGRGFGSGGAVPAAAAGGPRRWGSSMSTSMSSSYHSAEVVSQPPVSEHAAAIEPPAHHASWAAAVAASALAGGGGSGGGSRTTSVGSGSIATSMRTMSMEGDVLHPHGSAHSLGTYAAFGSLSAAPASAPVAPPPLRSVVTPLPAVTADTGSPVVLPPSGAWPTAAALSGGMLAGPGVPAYAPFAAGVASSVGGLGSAPVYGPSHAAVLAAAAEAVARSSPSGSTSSGGSGGGRRPFGGSR